MKFDIITIFPEFFESFKKESLIARAIKKRLISIKSHNLRKWTSDRHRTVDDRPYGGGAGMVLRIEPLYKAVQFLSLKFKNKSSKLRKKERIILLSAKGKLFTQKDARRFSRYNQIIFICGRYEGVDERVAKHIADEEISIGEYVLFGGETAAMVVMEAVSRLVPGTVAKEESTKNESFSNWKLENGKWKFDREYPQYTRPEIFEVKAYSLKSKAAWKVPKILLSGDHKKIAVWRGVNSRRASLEGRAKWRKKKSK